MKRAAGWLALALAGTIGGAASVAALGEPGDEHDAGCGAIELDRASPPRWVALPGAGPLTVHVEGARAAVAGRMAATGDGRRVFRPTFGLTPGVRYSARGEGCTATFEVPTPAATAPEVVAIYPRTVELPENVLRFYIYFSEPMSDGGFLEHVRLEHVESGEDLTGVFFDNIHELWSSDRRRITLLVDPGRVKTGLAANRRLGRAFAAGQTYRLHVRPSWRSLRGAPLRAGFSARWRAVSEDRQPVDVSAWRATSSARGPRAALHVDFGEAVDHVSVHRLLQVLGPDGRPVDGIWRIDGGDRTAHWTPVGHWRGAIHEHALHVAGRFEDIAGNNLGAAFDHRVGEVSPGSEDRPVTRPLAAMGLDPGVAWR